jgi:phosphoenolpyruvate carboxykinase (ATP)
MLIRPTPKQLADFGEPDFIIYNAGQFPANRCMGMSSTTAVEINFKRMEMVILGTEYAGEMKKGVFSLMVSPSSSFHLRILIKIVSL